MPIEILSGNFSGPFLLKREARTKRKRPTPMNRLDNLS
jgi:hypothetical protein